MPNANTNMPYAYAFMSNAHAAMSNANTDMSDANALVHSTMPKRVSSTITMQSTMPPTDAHADADANKMQLL